MSCACVCVLLLSAVVSGHGSPTFEVASIRPSSEQVAQVSAGMRIAGSQVRLTAMSVKEYIVIAYGVKPQQIVGPDWLGQSRFDLAATIPAGASATQVPEMLRALLDRFQMTMHRETKEFPVYVLGVAKGGPKIQPSKAAAPIAENTGCQCHGERIERRDHRRSPARLVHVRKQSPRGRCRGRHLENAH